MTYTAHYQSPLGRLVMTADDMGLTGLWFAGQKYFPSHLNAPFPDQSAPVLTAAKQWLDCYFSGQRPAEQLPLHFTGSPFQNQVWEILCTIPYGSTTTYGEIARILADRRGIPRMSAQAVGGAVGRNRISIIVPCHRVVGSRGNLTGYAGGIEKKAALLALERGADTAPCLSASK